MTNTQKVSALLAGYRKLLKELSRNAEIIGSKKNAEGSMPTDKAALIEKSVGLLREIIGLKAMSR